MGWRKNIRLGIVAALVSALIGGCSSQTTTGTSGTTSGTSTSPGTTDTVAVFFTLTADEGTVRSGTTMSLRIVAPAHTVMWFTDRPTRATGRIALKSFVENWSQFGFDEDPPNASLSGTTTDGRTDSLVLELGTPTLDGDELVFTGSLEGSSQGLTDRDLQDLSIVVDSTFSSGTVNTGIFSSGSQNTG